MTGADIVRVARSCCEIKDVRAAVRYRHQGRSREGVDCIGLPVLVRAELGLAPMDAGAYAKKTVDTAMLDYCRANMPSVPFDAMQPGDILVQMDGVVRHMAIVGDYPGALSIIHAWLPNRRVCECRLDENFMRNVRGCFRFPEVTA